MTTAGRQPVAVDAAEPRRRAVGGGAADVALERQRHAGRRDQHELHVAQRFPGLGPGHDVPIPVPAVRVHQVEEAEPRQRVVRIPDGLVPGAVGVEEVALERSRADQVTGVVEQVPVAGFALAQGLLAALPLAHVPGVEADADDHPPLVHDGGMGRLVPALDAVGAAETALDASGLPGARGLEALARLRNEVVDAIAFADPAAEDASRPFDRGGVERLDGAVQVHQHEGLEAGVEDGAEVRLRAPQRVLGAGLLGA